MNTEANTYRANIYHADGFIWERTEVEKPIHCVTVVFACQGRVLDSILLPCTCACSGHEVGRYSTIKKYA